MRYLGEEQGSPTRKQKASGKGQSWRNRLASRETRRFNTANGVNLRGSQALKEAATACACRGSHPGSKKTSQPLQKPGWRVIQASASVTNAQKTCGRARARIQLASARMPPHLRGASRQCRVNATWRSDATAQRRTHHPQRRLA
eukprot:6209365-Pleurochrysis_carterae.AAC.3